MSLRQSLASLVFCLLLVLAIGGLGAKSVNAAAFDPLQEVCSTGPGSTNTVCIDGGTGKAQTKTSNYIYGKDGILTKGANILSIVVGVASIVVVMIGSFKYITSGGDSASTIGARRTVLFALVGVVAAVLAQAIIIFVLNNIE